MTLVYGTDLASIKYTEPDGEVRTLSASDKSVLLAMADCAADDGSSVFLGVERLTWKTEISERAVRESLRHLRLAKVVFITKAASQHHPTHYRINVALIRGARRAGLDDESEVQQAQAWKPRPAPGAARPAPGAARPAPGAPNPSGTHQITTNHQNTPAPVGAGDAQAELPDRSLGAVSAPRTDPPAALARPGHPAVALFCEAWKVKYGQNPDLSGKDARTLVRLSKKQGLDEYGCRLERYLRDDDPFLVKLAHPPAQFENRWNSLGLNGNGAPRPAAPGFARAGRQQFTPADFAGRKTGDYRR
jgi:hypothetical protein